MTRFIPLQWLLLEQWRRNHLAATFSAALIGAGFMLVMPFLLASRVIPNERRASGFGLLSSFTMMGNAFGPILAGLLASINLHWVFWGDGILYGLLALMVYRRIGRGGRQRVVKFEGAMGRFEVW